MKVIIIIMLIILVLLILAYFLKKFKNPRVDTINIISGCVGGGKTSSVVCRVKRLLFRKYFLFRSLRLKNDYIIISNFPIGIKKKGRKYRNEFKLNKNGNRYIKVLGHEIECFDLNLNILLLQERVPQNECIIICDEFSKVASQFDYKLPCVKDNIDEFSSLWRHYTSGLSYCYFIDQCSENIFYQTRRRSSYCYNMINCIKIPLLPITIFEYRKILLSDEVDNVVQVDNASQESDIVKFIFLVNPFKFYDSYCYSNRYLLIDKVCNLKSSKYGKRDDVLKLKYKGKLYYKTLQADGINQEQYLLDKNK